MNRLKRILALLLCAGLLLYAPFGAPAQPYDPANVRPGVWNEMPVFNGDHMSIIGGMTIKTDVRPFYLDLLRMIDALPQT